MRRQKLTVTVPAQSRGRGGSSRFPIGGASGVNAGLGATVGGSNGIGVGAGVGIGNGVDVGVGVGVGGTVPGTTPGTPASGVTPGVSRAVAQMSRSQITRMKKRCADVLSNSGAYDSDLRQLCLLISRR